jgi:cytochrome c biogenesis protein CcdA
MGVLRIPWLYRTYQLTPPGNAWPLTVAGAAAKRRREEEERSLADETQRGVVWVEADGTPAAVMTPIAVRGTALSYGRSLGFGAAFAVAWTPCIGPVLGAILTLAAASTTVHQGAYLLLAYSAGLAVPFLIAGFALGSVTATLRRFHHLLPALEVTTGALIVVVGILVFLNEFTALNQYFDFIPELYGV